MTHQEEHHEHHRKEREEKKAERKEYEHEEERRPGSLHPAWYVVVGVLLAGIAILTWTFVIYPRYISPI